MSIIGAKVVGTLSALLLGGSVVAGAYVGGDYVDGIKDKIKQLEDKAELFHDEAWSKTQYVGAIISGKNGEITRLEEEIDRLEGELGEANDEVTRLGEEVNKANAEIDEANEDMVEVKTEVEASTDSVNSLPDIGGVTDGKAQVTGNPLTIAVVQSQSERTIKVGNPNTVPVTVYYSGGNKQITVEPADVAYIKDSTSHEVFSYTLDGKSYSTTK